MPRNIYSLVGNHKYVRDGRYFKKDMGKKKIV